MIDEPKRRMSDRQPTGVSSLSPPSNSEEDNPNDSPQYYCPSPASIEAAREQNRRSIEENEGATFYPDVTETAD